MISRDDENGRFLGVSGSITGCAGGHVDFAAG